MQEIAVAITKPKRNPRAEADVQHGVCASPFFSIEQFSRRNPFFTPGMLRWMVFKADENGIEAAGAIIRQGRNGRQIIIDEPKFFEWFRSRGRVAA